jgi:SAM-dependent methyltransferase
MPTDTDPYHGRTPTSHERMAGQPWDASYDDGPAPWDIGHPQPAIARVVDAGGIRGTVLDAGCGTGETALYVAARGHVVLGVDVAATAIEMARAKSHARAIDAEFAVADAFALEQLGRRFDTVIDSGLFHAFEGDERTRYAASVAAITEPGGTLYVLCFGDEGADLGPHPVARDDLRAAFESGGAWHVDSIEPERVHTNFHGAAGAPGWLATITRI